MKGASPMRSTIILLVIALTLLLPGCSKLRSVTQGSDQNQTPPQTFPDAQAAASQSLVTFRQLVNNQNFKDLGFESAEEVSAATLGQPIKILVVSLNQLLHYEPSSNPSTLLTDFHQIHYPVVVNEQVRSAILVDQVEGKWKAGTFGASKLAQLIGAARKVTASAEDSVVQVPALGLYFLAHTDDGRMTLTPLADYSDFGIKGGGAMPAEQVFATLQPVAKRMSPDTPM
jgi:hypothetical protein